MRGHGNSGGSEGNGKGSGGMRGNGNSGGSEGNGKGMEGNGVEEDVSRVSMEALNSISELSTHIS